MKKIIVLSLASASLLLAVDRPLKTHTELSLVDSTGNTESTSFAFEFKADKNYGQHEFRADANAYYTQDNDATSKNKWAIELNYDYMITEKFSFNYLLGYKKDRFSGFDYQFYTGPGCGYKLIATPEHKLNLQGNLMYSVDKDEDAADANDYVSYGLGVIYGWQILDNLKFKQELNYRGSFDESDNYFVKSKTGFESKLNDIFSMGVSYAIDYANIPGDSKEATDRTLLASLIIDY